MYAQVVLVLDRLLRRGGGGGGEGWKHLAVTYVRQLLSGTTNSLAGKVITFWILATTSQPKMYRMGHIV